MWVKMLIGGYYIIALGRIQCTLAVNCPADLQLSCTRGRLLSLLVELTGRESRVAIFSTYQITNKLLFHISSSYSSIMLPLLRNPLFRKLCQHNSLIPISQCVSGGVVCGCVHVCIGGVVCGCVHVCVWGGVACGCVHVCVWGGVACGCVHVCVWGGVACGCVHVCVWRAWRVGVFMCVYGGCGVYFPIK